MTRQNDGNHRHGGRVFEAARLLGRHWSEIVDFSANINPLGQPRGLKTAVFNDFDRTLHYPEVMAETLVAQLAELTGLSEDNILAGAGSTPHLHLLPRACGLRKPVIIGPAFAEYEGALRRAGLEPQYVLAQEEDEWLVRPETLRQVFSLKPDAVFLAHPANPTGRLVPEDVLLQLADGCEERGIWLVLDEAFISFTENGFSLLPQVQERKKLIVLRSLTKIFALPGLRLAFLAAGRETAKALACLTEPWSLSSPAISAGHFCLAHQSFVRRSVKEVTRLRDLQFAALSGLDLGRVFPSESNYIFLNLRPELDSRKLIQHLFEKGILVRDASNFYGLKKGFLRLAVRPENEIAALCEAVRSFPA